MLALAFPTVRYLRIFSRRFLPSPRRHSATREFWVTVALLWLAGVGLRLTILAVPPVITRIQADLHLSGTEIGILSGLPVLLSAPTALIP